MRFPAGALVCAVLCLRCADVFCAPASMAPATRDIAVSAIKEAARENYAKARSLARKSASPLVVKLTEWMYLTNPKSSPPYEELKTFADKNASWPRFYIIRRQTEKALLKQNDTKALTTWFEEHPPVSTEAFLRYADILFDKKDWEKAVPMIHSLWIKGDLSDSERRQMREKYDVLLDERDYASRIRRLLRDKRADEVRELAPFAGAHNKKIIHARLALITNAPDADEWTDLPEKKKDAGLLFDVVRWMRRNKRPKEAARLMAENEAGKTEPSLWWTERAALIREFISAKKYKDAYLLAKDSHLSDGGDFADAEWLAGWISLRFLNEPTKALTHFTNMANAVSSPVSVARAEYWLGRTHEALGSNARAQEWYVKASQKITTLYGQLAADKVTHISPVPDFPPEPVPSPATLKRLKSTELFRAAMLLQKAKEVSLVEPFILRLYADMTSPEDIFALARLATDELHRPDLAVDIARRARLKNVYIVSLGYPVVDIGSSDVERAIVLSIIRQESNFAPHVVSPAGARGLMQIMPATAKHIMRKKKLSAQKLNDDPQWNITVGSKYLNWLINKYNGSYILAIAAYNAGPGNVSKWIKNMGTPEDDDIDNIDWIEQIPFPETRNYVLRVLENLHVYRRSLAYPQTVLTQWSAVKPESLSQSAEEDGLD